MAIHNLAAQLRFPENATAYYRQQVARDMVVRGGHFIGAAILLKGEGGHPYVWRHNFCQGIEVLLKGLLLLKDFDAYWPQMRRFGHKLLPICDAAAKEYGVSQPTGGLRGELETLSRFYEQHWLRYSGGFIAFIDPDSIAYERAVRRVAAVLRLLARSKIAF